MSTLVNGRPSSGSREPGKLGTYLSQIKDKAEWATNVRRTSRNWPEVLTRTALSVVGHNRGTFAFKTRSGLTLRCPAYRAAIVAVLEVLANDCYRLEEIEWAAGARSYRVLDVGAHVGSFTCMLSRYLPGATFTCVEPSGTTAGWLQQNLDGNHLSERANVIQAGVAETDGMSTLWEKAPGDSGASVNSWRGTKPAEMRTYTFDTLVQLAGGPPDIVKIDCEGGEYAAILSSSGQAWHNASHLFLEYHPAKDHNSGELKDRLSELGLQLTWEEPAALPGLGLAYFRRSGPG